MNKLKYLTVAGNVLVFNILTICYPLFLKDNECLTY